MMGQGDPQRTFFYNISLETFVPEEHPLRAIRPLIDDRAIRQACRALCSPIQQLLGHADFSTTAVYTKVSDPQLGTAVLMPIVWEGIHNLGSRSYTRGYCVR